MAPMKTKLVSSKRQEPLKGYHKQNTLGATTNGKGLKKSKAPPPKQQKTKPASGPAKKKKRVYTEKELGIPNLNMITPVGVNMPKGKKKGKIFVDDQV